MDVKDYWNGRKFVTASRRSPDSDLSQLRAMIKDADLPLTTVSAVETFLLRLPAYLFDSARVPRERLISLREALVVLDSAIDMQSFKYTLKLVRQGRDRVAEELTPAMRELRAQRFYLEHSRVALSPDPALVSARLASRGACYLAKDTLRDAIYQLDAIVNTTPDHLRSSARTYSERDLTRLRTMQSRIGACEVKGKSSALRDQITTQVMSLEKAACAQDSRVLRNWWGEIRTRLSAWDDQEKPAVLASLAMIHHFQLEQIYRELEVWQQGCRDFRKNTP